MFSRPRLLQLTEAMKGKLIVVFGDIVADRFIYGTPKRISREAPVLILRQYRDDILLGGAGNAINNIFSLGALPVPISVLGQDASGNALLAALSGQGIDCGGILLTGRYHTPTKVRILGGMPHASRQQIVRYDIEDRFEMTAQETTSFTTILRDAMGACDAALISDYGYGIVRPQIASALIESAHGKPVTLDSRYDLLSFPGVTAATPNEEEAAAAAGTSLWNGDEEKIDEVALTLQQSLDCEAVLITRGSRGMALLERACAPLHLPVSGTDQVADVTGAGDTVIATFTLALAAGASFVEAAKLANYAGGIVVMKMGTATVSNDELRHAIERDEELNDEPAAPILPESELAVALENERARGRTIAFANGCFDVLHVGHIRYLTGASAVADVLVVGVNSDESVRQLKGEGRPVMPAAERAEIIASLRGVSYVTVFDDRSPARLLALLRPDFQCKGTDYTPDSVPEADVVRSYGGRVVITGDPKAHSTTDVLRRMKADR